MNDTCECADPGCPHCAGKCTEWAEYRLTRIDFAGRPTCDMCQACGEDALDSGVFALEEG